MSIYRRRGVYTVKGKHGGYGNEAEQESDIGIKSGGKRESL